MGRVFRANSAGAPALSCLAAHARPCGVSVCLCVRVSACLCVCGVGLSACLLACLLACLPACLPPALSVCLSGVINPPQLPIPLTSRARARALSLSLSVLVCEQVVHLCFALQILASALAVLRSVPSVRHSSFDPRSRRPPEMLKTE